MPVLPKSTKLPTFNQQLKGLNPPGKQNATVPYNKENIEILNLLSSIKDALSKKYPGSSIPMIGALTTIRSKAKKAPDAIKYLANELKRLDPTADVSNLKVMPGKFYKLPVPTLPLSTTAKQHILSPESEVRAKILADKIAAYEAEILRLKNAQWKAEQERKKLRVNINPKLLKYFSYIEQHCSEFLKVVQETQRFLFRGQNDARLPIFVGHPRANREPKDSDPEAQQLADKYLTAMGFKALRSNSIFTTSSQRHAADFGTVYVIFPKNGFDFTWSTKHDDLVIDSVAALGGDDSEELIDIYNHYIEEIRFEEDEYIESFLVSNFKQFKYDTKETKNEVKKIKSNTEFKKLQKEILQWDYYRYAVNGAPITEAHNYFLKIIDSYHRTVTQIPYLKKIFSEPQLKKLNKRVEFARAEAVGISKDLKAKASKVIKDFGFTNKNLAAALKAEHEVCILGEYIAVKHKDFEKELKQYFLSSKVKVKKK